jgi:hypothetical protein
MAITVIFGASFGNKKEWERIRQKTGEVNSTEEYIRHDEFFSIILNGCCDSNPKIKFSLARRLVGGNFGEVLGCNGVMSV